MRRFANVYIVLFLIDAGLSLIDELLQLASSPMPALTEIRFFVAYVVIALSMILYACLGIDRRLPKRAFLPLTLFASWSALAMWPLSGFVAREAFGLTASISQVVIGAIAIILLRSLGGRNLLTEEQSQAPMFSLRNTLGFTAINLLLTPFVLIYTGLAVTSYYLEAQTAGFLRLSPVGVHMTERSYHLAQKEIRLAGMMHIGKEEYYEDLAKSIPTEGTIILAEGVTDQDRLLESQFNYSKLAGLIGLTSQDKMRLNGNAVELDGLGVAGQVIREPGKPDIANADIDLNRFEPKTIEFLNALGRSLFGDKPLAEGLVDYNLWIEENMSEEGLAGVMADILDKRNDAVIAGMVQTLKRYDTVIIPWGAMHMPAIEAAVLEQGFAPGKAQERLSLDFRTIPYGELWQKWSEQASDNL
ncbi:hypothetical protein P9J64_12620 [Deltaproteobacteria bacterium IMCC39524]|nr:hypothetical protein [Deltaproteobacteria bacterium IMCC39524]